MKPIEEIPDDISLDALMDNILDNIISIVKQPMVIKLVDDPVERKVRQEYVAAKREVVKLRMLLLTRNISRDEYVKKSEPIEAEIEKLAKLIWA